MVVATSLKYMSGFGNHFESEALPNTLPIGQNSPQKAPRGLYAEQLSGTAFSALRHENLRSWLYRIQPSVTHSSFKQVERGLIRHAPFDEVPPDPNQMRWDPLPLPTKPTNFIEGLVTICGNGGNGSVRGCATHVYAANKSMTDTYFYNSDGEFLFVPEQGGLRLRTEFGIIELQPGEIAVVPRGVKYQVELLSSAARGYVLENYGPALRLPYLSVIGANGLANPRDFQTPHAAFDRKQDKVKLLNKFQGLLFEAEMDHSPLDVVAWHGNYAPYKYDLKRFNTINTVSYDHLDPSIFTVLTSPSEMPGVANIDFVIFPPRWMVAEHSFRPPYYHRNTMSEYMGLIYGVYDAKEEGFVPGGASLHNAMSAHGPDCATFEKASTVELTPQYMGDTMAFMFESSLVFRLTEFAQNSPIRQKNYQECWDGLKSRFDGTAG
jgi:homogentisate 1,2-dioxygenase